LQALPPRRRILTQQLYMIAELLNPANYHFNWLAIPASLTATMMFVLGLVVLIRERHSRVSLSFFVMTAIAVVWLYGYSLIYSASTERIAAAWSFAGQFGVTFIPPSVYHFTVVSLQIYRQYRSRVWLMWIIAALFLLAHGSSEAFLDGVYFYSWGYYPKYNWMGFLFIVFFFAQMALSLRHYWASYRAAVTDIGRSRNRGLFTAFCVAYFGSVDYLPAFGVGIYPIGCFAILGFIALVDRTIRRYHLLNITPAFAAREIINAMDDALLIFDDEGMVRVANRSSCRMFSRSEAELEGSSVAVVARAFAAEDDDLAGRILNGSLRDYECSTNSRAAVVNLSSFVIPDQANNPMATVFMIRDISEQRAAREQIQRHIERQSALYELNLAATSTLELRSVLDVLLERLADLKPGTAVAVMLLGEDRQLRKVACRGVDEDGWKREPYGGGGLAHPVLENRDAVLIADLQAENDSVESQYFLRRGFRSYLGLPLIAKDQTVGILSFYSKGNRLHDEQEINFLRGLAGQTAVAIYNSQLYEQTSRQALALEKANQVKEDFLSVMSHELRTPLNVIFGYTKLLQEGVMGSINPEQNKALDKVIHHSNELLFMVNSIMNATKIEADAITIDREEFLLTPLLNEIRDLYDYPLGKEIVLKWDYPADLPHMFTDRDKLKHIMQNLINNALKFTDDGVVTVSARQRSNDAQVQLTVTDMGVGIAAEELPQIFDRFRQVDSSRTRGFGGVGLGLHIVKTFTQLLGGTVTVTSAPGQGSAFTVVIPCVCRASIGPELIRED
jgi:PAS domain S-box-containing protein